MCIRDSLWGYSENAVRTHLWVAIIAYLIIADVYKRQGEIYNFTAMHPYSAPVLNPDGSYAYLSDVDGYGPDVYKRQRHKMHR